MKFLILLLALSVCGFSQNVPPLVTYQGRLTDANGNPAPDGTGYEIEIRLWSAAIGGAAPVWGARYSGVPVKQGGLNVILGSSSGIPINGAVTADLATAFNNTNLFLGMTVTKGVMGAPIANPSEILPRQQWMTSPFAFRANLAGFAQTIGDNSVTGAKIVDGAVSSAKIANGSVTTEKIPVASIPPSKLNPSFIVLSEQLPSGTQPQTGVRGWQVRTLNTIESVSGDNFGFSNEADTIALTPGTYELSAQVPFLCIWGKNNSFTYGSMHRSALKRMSSGELIGLTSSHALEQQYHSYLEASAAGAMQVSAIFTVTQTESFQLVHYIRELVNSSSNGSDGQPSSWGLCGKAASVPNTSEIYSRVTIKALK